MVGWEVREYETKSDNKGYWNINIPTPKFGGPYSITISDGKKVVLRNVMILGKSGSVRGNLIWKCHWLVGEKFKIIKMK